VNRYAPHRCVEIGWEIPVGCQERSCNEGGNAPFVEYGIRRQKMSVHFGDLPMKCGRHENQRIGAVRNKKTCSDVEEAMSHIQGQS
jgi:hypothetical protein